MKAGKYARIERERRYHLLTMPAELTRASAHHLICDRYITSSRLRLRQITDSDGVVVARKLTQKELVANLSTDETVITNLYLNEAEFDLLLQLPAQILEKKRYHLEYSGRQFVIDQFLGKLEGLLLAEIEDRFNGLPWPPPQPSFARLDVTDDPIFRGGHLINLSRPEFKSWQRSWAKEG